MGDFREEKYNLVNMDKIDDDNDKELEALYEAPRLNLSTEEGVEALKRALANWVPPGTTIN